MSIRDLYCWIIPARAGPTTPNQSIVRSRSNHPRSCGANLVLFCVSVWFCGSSPLVRGQLKASDELSEAERIIPARAGPTERLLLECSVRPDHPRSCGANLTSRHAISYCNGSSPLVRGQRPSALGVYCMARIIPARAGPTGKMWAKIEPTSDHPRSCGANLTSRHAISYCSGSSPLVRGQPARTWQRPTRSRIIPARAGPTSFPFLWWPGGSDHPRSCGANPWPMCAACPTGGSSPLVRGQRWCR